VYITRTPECHLSPGPPRKYLVDKYFFGFVEGHEQDLSIVSRIEWMISLVRDGSKRVVCSQAAATDREREGERRREKKRESEERERERLASCNLNL
jgi:hypothetical protein